MADPVGDAGEVASVAMLDVVTSWLLTSIKHKKPDNTDFKSAVTGIVLMCTPGQQVSLYAPVNAAKFLRDPLS